MTTLYPGDTLTATPATSTGNPAPSTAYQWLQDGEELPGATSNTLVLTDDHSDHLISVRQSISNFLSTNHAISTVLGPVQQYPAALFKSSEVGVWYDPSDVANLDWRRNLLTYTEQFDNAVWGKSNASVIVNSISSPDSMTTAEKLVEALDVNKQHDVRQTNVVSSIGTYAFSVYAKSAERTRIALGQFSSPARCTVFDLSNGTVVGAAAAYLAATDATIENVGNGWYRCSIIQTITGTQSFFVCLVNDSNTVFYNGDGTSGVYIWGAQLEVGSTATEYQRISNVTNEVFERFPKATLYQDVAGTTPVTTPGQSVALMLDKSQGLELGPELLTNGDFSNGTTGWLGTTSVIANGVASWTGASGVIEIYRPENLFVSGKTYSITGDVTRFVAKGSFFIRVASWDISAPISGVGKFSLIATAPNNGGLNIISFGGANLDIDNISVRELLGNHATQATASQRPTYAVEPVTGRRNLLTYTEQFDNAAWEKLSSVTVAANTVLAPNGTTTADKIIETATNNFHGLRPGGLTAGLIYTFQVSLKEAERRYAVISLGGNDTALAGGGIFVDLRNGSVISAVGSKLSSYSVNDQGNGWFSYRISVNMTGVAETPYAFVFIIDNSTHTIGVGYGYKIYTGDGTSGIYIWGAQIETGSTATAYQCVASQYDVTESGVPTLHYLSFDGVDDVMQTGTITPGVDKVQVFAGVRKLSDAVYGIVVEFGINIPNGSFWLLNGDGSVSPGPQWQFRSRGTTTWGDATTAAISPITSVLTGLGDISGDSAILRVNGVQASSSTADQGTGNYLPQPLYVGARGGPVISLNGRIYGLITRFGANLSNDQITRAETWIARKTGITL